MNLGTRQINRVKLAKEMIKASAIKNSGMLLYYIEF